MYHTLYKTINSITGQYYYGVHATDDPQDTYLGSGIRLKNNIRKYGRHNFKKVIIESFNSGQEALQAEKKIVNIKILKDPLCLNLTEGGQGQPKQSGKIVGDKISKTLKRRGIKPSRVAIENSIKARKGRPLSPEHRKKMSLVRTGRIQTQEEKEKRRQSLIEYHKKNTPPWIGFSQSEKQKDKAREAMHRRWHVSREIVKESCNFCS